MIRRAELRGDLTRDRIILEATSGNTGIGLALICAVKGYRLRLAMSEAVSEERKKILRALGAELLFTPAALGTDGAIETVYTLLREHPDTYYSTDQFNNPDNWAAHYEGTGEEIWRQTEGRVNLVVATLGTTGTAMGISRRLKEYRADIRMVGVEPFLHHRIQGLKNMKESYRPGIFDRTLLDEKVNILDEDAFAMARRLAREEGIFAGMSSGAAVHVAVQKALEMEEGWIVAVLPDGGERYLSTDLFLAREESSLRFYNGLTREKTPFRPIHPERVLMHTCGPTVHEVPHIGSYRRFVVSDLIRRYLGFRGYAVHHVMNIIDLADRCVRGAEQAGMPLDQYTDRYARAFLRDLDQLNVLRDRQYPRASENVDAMLALVERLVEKGFAYEKLRSVYFDISKLDDYGVLSNIDLAKVKPGRTVEVDDYEKDSPVDFTLLKRSTLNELKRGVYFKTRWGNVRPSWHLECAAIALAHLGETFDIHASGADILFPHCENVMALGKAATGRRSANYWLHTELVMADGQKMSRSLNNVRTIEDLERMGFRGKEIRFFLLGSHYRKPLNFSLGGLETAKNTIRRLNGFIQRLTRMTPGPGFPDLPPLLEEVQQGFVQALDDDLNISGGLAALFDFVRKVNGPVSKAMLNREDRDRVLAVMDKIDSVLGIMDFGMPELDAEAERLLQEREALRREGRWDAADAIRERLADRGIEVFDTPEGVAWNLKARTGGAGGDAL